MYLSRLTLNPRNRQVQQELGNSYQLHRTIMRGFPETLPASERVLYRLEIDPRSGALAVLVQSIHQPDWSPLREAGQGNYLLQPPDGPKHFDPVLSVDQVVRFRLRANPTVKKKRDGDRNGNRVPLVREEEQIDWLKRKGELHGFQLLQTQVTGNDSLSGRKKEGATTHKLQIYVVQFDGLLKVADPDRFADTLAQGIGPAKGFGCGLLSLARAA